MREKIDPKTLRVGMKVRSDWRDGQGGDPNLVRTLTKVVRSIETQTGVRVWLDGGGGQDPCPTCGRGYRNAPSIDGVDSAWITEIVEGPRPRS